MLRRAKSFFIKKKKTPESQSLPVEFLSEKSHLARKPIVVDPDRRVIAFAEPPDVPDSNPLARSDLRLREKEENEVEIRPANFRRRTRPKTIDVPLGRPGRMSFPPSVRGSDTDVSTGKRRFRADSVTRKLVLQ